VRRETSIVVRHGSYDVAHFDTKLELRSVFDYWERHADFFCVDQSIGDFALTNLLS